MLVAMEKEENVKARKYYSFNKTLCIFNEYI